MAREHVALVTGAEGFIGSRLAACLEAKGWRVVSAVRLPIPSVFRRFSHPVACDLRDRDRVVSVVLQSKPTHVFHLAAESHPTSSWIDPVATFESNVVGSFNLFEALRRLKRPPVIVSACSGAEYGCVSSSRLPIDERHGLRPVNPYGFTKLCLDAMSRFYNTCYGLRTVALRLFNTTGPGKTMDAPSDFIWQLVRIRRGLQPPILEVGNLTSRRSFLHVDDAVNGFYLASLKGRAGEVYNLCADRPILIRTLARLAIRLSGVRASLCTVARLLRPLDEKTVFGNSAKFRKLTGWQPSISLESTLLAMFDHAERCHDSGDFKLNSIQPF